MTLQWNGCNPMGRNVIRVFTQRSFPISSRMFCQSADTLSNCTKRCKPWLAVQPMRLSFLMGGKRVTARCGDTKFDERLRIRLQRGR